MSKTTALPTDAAMRWWRDHCEFICTCHKPLPQRLENWNDWQCKRCGKKVMAINNV